MRNEREMGREQEKLYKMRGKEVMKRREEERERHKNKIVRREMHYYNNNNYYYCRLNLLNSETS